MHNLFSALGVLAKQFPDRPAILGDSQVVTYASLVRAISALSARLPEEAATVAIAGLPSAEWIAADLAATLARRRVVPLPGFFSADQQRHILSDAAVDLVLDCGMGLGDSLFGVPVLPFDQTLWSVSRPLPEVDYAGGAERVIYTSGTTGAPKGVRHGDRQMDFAIAALGDAAGAHGKDRHLSLLPPSLLLEQIAGQFLPLSVGATIILAPQACLSMLSGDVAPLAAALTREAPTTTVLVPQQLAALVQFAEVTGWKAPNSLRLVAVGGAPIAPETLRRAQEIGLPVRFGYGLSECCSVVSVQRGATPSGDPIPTTGPPLPGTQVEIVDGQIVVTSPGVMIGYLGQAPLRDPVWHTGDLGRIDANGNVTVLGRVDRVLTLSTGRNVAAEWLEGAVSDLPWVAEAHAAVDAKDGLVLTVTADPMAEELVGRDRADVSAAIARCFQNYPSYATPARIQLVMPGCDGPIQLVSVA